MIPGRRPRESVGRTLGGGAPDINRPGGTCTTGTAAVEAKGEGMNHRSRCMRRQLHLCAALLLAALVPGCAWPAGSTSTSAEPGGPAATTTIPWASTTVPPGELPRETLPPETPTTRTTQSPTTVTSLPAIPEGGVEYGRLPGDSKRVALTFDASYDPTPLSSILATLESEGVPATFFFTGQFVEGFPEAVAAVVASGAPIGNHSYSHADFTKASPDEIRSQLQRTADLLTLAGADDPRPLFRFPYGARNKATLAILGSEGYVSVYWTIDTLDWKPERTTQEIHDVVMAKLGPGAIVLMHVGGRETASVLPSLIRDIRAKGYEFVDLRTALR